VGWYQQQVAAVAVAANHGIVHSLAHNLDVQKHYWKLLLVKPVRPLLIE
jgi:hypothetical protein